MKIWKHNLAPSLETSQIPYDLSGVAFFVGFGFLMVCACLNVTGCI